MARVAMDAAQDVPALRGEDCPTWDGLIVCAAPLPPIETAARRDGATRRRMAPVDAIAWARRADTIRVTLLARPEHTTRSAAHTQAAAAGFPMNPFLVPVATISLPTPLDLTGPAPEDAEIPAGEWPAIVAVAAFLSSAWVLMDTPTVGHRRILNAHPTSSSTRTQAGASSQRDAVTLVDLRPMRNVCADDEPQEEGRRLTTRHVVRGHWTHQPHGPGRELRRLQWIASYTRGPEGAPLVERDTVYIWRR